MSARPDTCCSINGHWPGTEVAGEGDTLSGRPENARKASCTGRETERRWQTGCLSQEGKLEDRKAVVLAETSLCGEEQIWENEKREQIEGDEKKLSAVLKTRCYKRLLECGEKGDLREHPSTERCTR